MNIDWKKVRLVFGRELRDQLRDRRTLMTMVLLPLLLYPLLGAVFLQISQFMQEHPTRIRVIGAGQLPESPQLMDGDRFHPMVCSDHLARLMTLAVDQDVPADVEAEGAQAVAERQIRNGEYDAVVFVPRGFGEQLELFQDELVTFREEGNLGDFNLLVPEPEIFVNSASDKSRIAYDRVNQVLREWRESIVRDNLIRSHVPASATEPFQLAENRCLGRSTTACGCLVQDLAVCRTGVGIDRCLPASRGYVRGRKRTRYVRDAAQQSRTTIGDGVGQDADRNAFQLRIFRIEFGEHGRDGNVYHVATGTTRHGDSPRPGRPATTCSHRLATVGNDSGGSTL